MKMTTRLVVNLWVAACGFLTSSSTFAALTITFDHQTLLQSASKIPELGPGEEVHLRVINTDSNCFNYNGGAKQHDPAEAAATDTVNITIYHARRTEAYTMTLTKKVGADDECQEVFKHLREQSWTFEVSTLGWELGFAGAFTVDGLVDQRYFVDQSVSPGVIARDSDAENSTNQRLALMVHLYNSTWEKDASVSWSPIAFGVSIDDQTRYLVGTSVRFTDRLYLTGGVIVGKRKGLPVGLHVGDPVQDPNALSNLADKTDSSWFIAFSYSFLGTGVKDQLSKAFGKTSSPTP